MVVPFPPGGSTSIVARIVAERMAEALGQQFIIDNRGGAGGTIGTRQVAKSAPDGYTLEVGYTGTLAIAPALYRNVGYDVRTDFTAVGRIGVAPSTLVVHPSFPAKTVAEFIAYAKANPGKVNYGSAGIGTVAHVAGEYFALETGIKLVHIPYKGTGPAMTDLLGGHIPAAFPPIPAAHEAVKSGLLRILAVTSIKRSALMPEVPTIAESACRASTRRCATGSWRRPVRRGRSWTSSTRRSARRLPPRMCATALRSRAPSRYRARRRNTPPTSIGRRHNGRG